VFISKGFAALPDIMPTGTEKEKNAHDDKPDENVFQGSER